MSSAGLLISTKEDTTLHYEVIIADLEQGLADVELKDDDTNNLQKNRKRYFQTGVERIREMRENMEGFVEQAGSFGMPDSAFKDWRSVLDRQEKGFQDQMDRSAGNEDTKQGSSNDKR